MKYIILLYTAIIASNNMTLSLTSLGLLEVPNWLTYWVAVKINDQTALANFGKRKTFQLVYHFTIYATLALCKTTHFQWFFQFADGVSKIDFVWKFEIFCISWYFLSQWEVKRLEISESKKVLTNKKYLSSVFETY